jgi:hypothetical protein
MTQDIRSSARAGFGKGAALFPLAFVATAVAILAVGAGRTSEPEKAPSRATVASADRAASKEDIARDNARAEEAAAAAMMALALARVAPTVDEARLAEAERAAQAPRVDPDADAQKARKVVRREAPPAAAPVAPSQGARPPATTVAPPVAEPAPVFASGPEKAAEKPAEKPGMLRRMGEYVPSLPSPGRIVDAMGNGVSKIADLMPNF